MKISKAEANYGPGYTKKDCSKCTMFRGDSCAAVKGDISPYGVCRLHEARPNPFRRSGGVLK